MTFFSILTVLCVVIALAGCLQSTVGAMLLAAFRYNEKKVVHIDNPPPVTVMKPLYGNEPLLEEALESFCQQDYPCYQVLFGVCDDDDPAIDIVRRLQKRYPNIDMELIVNSSVHGVNRKISNLMNVYPKAKYDILVISDSDIHVRPDYLKHIVSTLEEPNTGLVTTLYAGKIAQKTMIQIFSACQINHNFLPGVILSRYLGRQDCLGATMAIKRHILEQIGGLKALLPYVADDAMLGNLVREQNLNVSLANCLIWTTIPESNFTQLLQHEIRWGRTVCTLAPLGYASAAIQLPLFWGALPMILHPFSVWSYYFFLVIWFFRVVTSFITDKVVAPLPLWSFLLLPARDWLSALIMIKSAKGREVYWRGQTMHLAPSQQNSTSSVSNISTGT